MRIALPPRAAIACTPNQGDEFRRAAHGLLIELRKLMFGFDYLAHGPLYARRQSVVRRCLDDDEKGLRTVQAPPDLRRATLFGELYAFAVHPP